jgi:hypothetical protein
VDIVDSPKLSPRMPKIGETINNGSAIRLSEWFGLNHVIDEIEWADRTHPDIFKPWVFDGCSCVPDRLLGITGVRWTEITYKCALIHDLEYAYGISGDTVARKNADVRFYDNLIGVGLNRIWANIFYYFVRVGGAECFGRSFSWGFARNDAHKNS